MTNTIGEHCKSLKKSGYKVSEIAKKLGIHVTAVYYHTNPKRKKQSIERSTARRIENKIHAVAYKGGKCERCGYYRCNHVLTFHHKNPYKKDLIVAGTTLSWERVKKELDKTIMLCSNCHIEFHADAWGQEELDKFELKFYPAGINTGKNLLPLSKRRRKYDPILKECQLPS